MTSRKPDAPSADPLDAAAMAGRWSEIARRIAGPSPYLPGTKEEYDWRCDEIDKALLAERRARVAVERHLAEADAVIHWETEDESVHSDAELADFDRWAVEALKRHASRTRPSDDRRTP